MPTRQASNQAGFTIVELLIAISVFFLVLASLFSILQPSQSMYEAGHRKLDVQQSARVAMDMMVRELRMTGYFPENFDAVPGNDIPVANRNPIQVGTGTGLAIYGAATGCLDADADGICDPDQTPVQPRSQVFLFCLTGTNLVFKVGGLGAAASYDCTVNLPGQQILATNITALTFTYFDGNGNVLAGPLDGQNLGVAPAFAVTAQRAAVRSVAITLTAQDAVPGQSPQAYTLRSNVRLRNL